MFSIINKYFYIFNSIIINKYLWCFLSGPQRTNLNQEQKERLNSGQPFTFRVESKINKLHIVKRVLLVLVVSYDSLEMMQFLIESIILCACFMMLDSMLPRRLAAQ